jgi:hypothetical protein
MTHGELFIAAGVAIGLMAAMYVVGILADFAGAAMP